MKVPSYKWGIVWAGIIMLSWLVLGYLLLHQEITGFSWWIPVGLLLMTHLFTGLFITAHDAIHGTVYPANQKINHAIGAIAAFGMACNMYGRLRKKHFLHHEFPATEQDPDYHPTERFWKWYVSFLGHYVSWYQIVLVAVGFNVLAIWFSEWNITLFLTIPALLSTLQLFYFGTYRPHMGHKGESHNEHKSGSQRANHVMAFVTCYYFGYHYEHHDQPHVPWWLLPKAKTLAIRKAQGLE